MAKSVYKIPASISRSKLDHEVVITGWDISLKPLPVKSILYFFACAFFLAWAVTQSPLSNAPIPLLVLFMLWFIVVAVFFGRRTKTGEMVFNQIPALVQYLPKGRRKILTRRTSKPFDFMELLNIKDIDESGLIYFLDGSFGQGYSVVGSASRLVFDGDRAHIVNRVDNFFRKIDTKTEYIFLTMKEPQRVHRQLNNFNKQINRMKYTHPELRALMQEKYEIARDDVGGRFNSIHQYVILKAPTMDALKASHQLLRSEVENSRTVFAQCTMLNNTATVDMLSTLFKKRDIEVD